MKQITVRELRSEFPKAMKWIHAGQRVQITKRGTVVAELSPPDTAEAVTIKPPNFETRLNRRDKGKLPTNQTWASMIAEDRE